MQLKAVLLDFNGIVINDEALHQQLIEQLLIEENLRPNSEEINQSCLGRSDRACISELMQKRGRVISEEYLDKLITRKSEKYRALLQELDKLPLYAGLEDLIFKIQAAQLKLAIVSGACRREISWVLGQTSLVDAVSIIVSSDDIDQAGSKPSPDGYLLAVERLNIEFPQAQITPRECIAIEDSFAGIEAAKRAGIPVVGVAHSYPFQMIHRRADWVVDYLTELDFDWLRQRYQTESSLRESDSNLLVEQ